MVALFYLPVTSPLVCASHDPMLLSAWAIGHAQTLIEAAEESAQRAVDPAQAALRLQTAADMCLLHGRWDEADRLYRRSMRRLVEPQDIDTFACRAGGLRALFHNRLEPAAGCFQRLAQQGNSTEVRLEARLVLALLFHQASLFAEAHADLSRVADLAVASALEPWLDLAHVASRHFALLARIHACAELDGHVEWRAAPEPPDTIARLARPPTPASRLEWDASIGVLLAQRQDHVHRLDLLSDRTHRETDETISPLVVRTWGHSEPELTRAQAFIEMTKAALSTRRVRLAGLLLDPVLCDHPVPEPLDSPNAAQARAARRSKRARLRALRASRAPLALPPAAAWPPLTFPPSPHVAPTWPQRLESILWNDAPKVDPKEAVRPKVIAPLEQDYIYVVSRLRVQQGRNDEGARHYRSYLRRALAGIGKLGTALRRSIEEHADFTPAPRAPSKPMAPLAPLVSPDDVTRRLPLRYLDAYRYMLEHLSRPDLSMSEVAKQARLSERSLQMAFRRYLDESPRDLLRRRRMERIHAELRLLPHSQDGLMEVAQRYGVTTRSALLAGFRKYYAQTPTDSLDDAALTAAQARQGAPDAASGPVISQADVAGSP